MLFEDTSAWHLTALQGLWVSEEDSEVPLSETPRVGGTYRVRLEGTVFEPNKIVKIEFLPPLAYFNGIETRCDLDGLRLFGGRILKSSPTSQSPDSGTGTEIEFEILSEYGLAELEKLTNKNADELEFWKSFFDPSRFFNIHNLESFILLSWAIDAYVGTNCILRKSDNGFALLYCHEWADGWIDRVNAGKIDVPVELEKILNNRLKKMEHQGSAHWSGHSI